MKPRIVKSTWFPFWAAGFTFYPFAFCRTSSNNWNNSEESRHHLIRHELIHCWQVRKKGWITFYVSYCWEAVKNFFKYWSFNQAYLSNKYEMEAYDNQNLPDYLPKELEDLVRSSA